MTALPHRIPQAHDEIERLYRLQHEHRAAVANTTAAQRIEKLKRFEHAMMSRRDEIVAAMWEDFKKPPVEVDLSEIFPVVSEARHAARHLKRWMRPKRAATRMALLGTTSRIVHEPKGVVLIIAPWNFPFNLALSPVVSAVAAGNCIVLKPSELAPASAACMKRILGEVFDENEVAVVEGDASVAEALLRKRWDHIFFTGSPAIGRVVMKAAAEHLTPVTLELGGKSPVIVDRTADLDEAARRLAWGKMLNAGQICVAPDYLLLDESVRDAFLPKLRAAIASLGNEDSRSIIVNDRHAARVKRLVDDAVASGAKLEMGGECRGREIEPTVLSNVTPDSAVMQEEIFGPVLPVMTYRSLSDAYRIIAEREKPLVMYIFSRSRRVVRDILAHTSAGGTAINHTLIQFYALDLPFGGVGNSGIGKSHGFFGFEAFSNARGVLDQRLRFSALELMFPPYGGKFQRWLVDFTMRWL